MRKNDPIARNIYLLELEGDTSAITRSGQFVNIRLPSCFLRRPISVCDWSASRLTLIYKVVGRGTGQLSKMAPGQSLDLLTGLGNGFDTEIDTQHPVLVGGGVGVPPLYHLAKQLIAEGKTPIVILGFRTAAEAFFTEEFRLLGPELHVMTGDGSLGQTGLVTDAAARLAAENRLAYLYACGPMPMLHALYRLLDKHGADGQFSLEERMGCGFGGCMGCSFDTPQGPIRICKEGPVLRKEQLPWH